MDLKIRDVADLLGVSETTIRRWLAEGKIPAYRLNHQYRFSRPEIENWMLNCRINQQEGMSPFQSTEKDSSASRNLPSSGWQTFGLYRALHKGDVIVHPTSKTKEGIIRETTKAIADRFNLDADVVSDLLLDRESLMPTALGEGFAIPHTRDFLLQGGFDAVFIVFPKEPLDWGALDSKPTHTLLFLFACDDRHHLNLLAKIAHLTSNPEMSHFLSKKPDKEELLSFIKSWELDLQDVRS